MRIALIAQPDATPSSVMLTLDMVNIASRYPEAAGCQLDLLSIEGGACGSHRRFASKRERCRSY